MDKNRRRMPDKSMSYDQITEEVDKLRWFISQYNKGLIPYPGFDYRKTLWTLRYLLNKRRLIKRRSKSDD